MMLFYSGDTKIIEHIYVGILENGFLCNQPYTYVYASGTKSEKIRFHKMNIPIFYINLMGLKNQKVERLFDSNRKSIK